MRKILLTFTALIAMVLLVSNVCWAGENEITALDLKTAVEMALGNSNDLQSADWAISKAYEQRKDAVDQVRFIPLAGSSTTPPLAEVAWSNLLKSDLNWQMKKKDLEEKKEQITLEVCKQYVTVSNAQKGVVKAEMAVERDRLALKNARLLLQVGMGSKVSVTNAATQEAISLKTLQAARESLDKAYIGFNGLLGLDVSKRLPLSTTIVYEPLNVEVDWAFLTERAIENSTDIWKLQKAVEMEQVDLDFPYGAGMGYRRYDVEKYDVDMTLASLDAAKKGLREQVQMMFHEIAALEEQIDAAKQVVLISQENLRVASVQYQVGMNTAEQVKKAKAALVDAECNLATLINSHYLLKVNFIKLTGESVMQILENQVPGT